MCMYAVYICACPHTEPPWANTFKAGFKVCLVSNPDTSSDLLWAVCVCVLALTCVYMYTYVGAVSFFFFYFLLFFLGFSIHYVLLAPAWDVPSGRKTPWPVFLADGGGTMIKIRPKATVLSVSII